MKNTNENRKWYKNDMNLSLNTLLIINKLFKNISIF